MQPSPTLLAAIADADKAADDADKNTQTTKPQDREDDLLDEGLEETFPASDPVSAKHIT